MNAELEIAMMSAVERMQKEVRDSNLEAKEPSWGSLERERDLGKKASPLLLEVILCWLEPKLLKAVEWIKVSRGGVATHQQIANEATGKFSLCVCLLFQKHQSWQDGLSQDRLAVEYWAWDWLCSDTWKAKLQKQKGLNIQKERPKNCKPLISSIVSKATSWTELWTYSERFSRTEETICIEYWGIEENKGKGNGHSYTPRAKIINQKKIERRERYGESQSLRRWRNDINIRSSFLPFPTEALTYIQYRDVIEGLCRSEKTN